MFQTNSNGSSRRAANVAQHLKQCEQKSINFTFLSSCIVYLRQCASLARLALKAGGWEARGMNVSRDRIKTESERPGWMSSILSERIAFKDANDESPTPFRGWKRMAKKQIETAALGSAIIFVVTIALRVADDARAQLKRALAIKYAWCGIFGARSIPPCCLPLDRAAKKQVGKFEEGNYSQRCASCNEAT